MTKSFQTIKRMDRLTYPMIETE